MTMPRKVVAITGAARGIGYETARQLIAEGATVAIGDIDETRLEQAATELGIQTWARLDVTDPASFRAFLDRVEAAHGDLDVLINNAGIMPNGLAHEETDEITRRQVEINILGVIYGTKQALQRMLPRGRGHIINTASLAGETEIPGLATYCATKHAVIAFTESTRLECRGTGVTLSTVRPTFTNTELVSGVPSPRGLRNAEPADIAAATVKLIQRPRPFVRITALAGGLTVATKFVPRRPRERIAHVLNLDTVFLEGVDDAARASYRERIERRNP